MKLKKVIILLVSILTISLIAMIPINRSYNKKVEPWMSYVNDDVRLVDMSIPGTHDSGATHSIFDVSGKCQELNIKQQLNVGVRFFDLRLQLKNDDFKIIHGPVDQRLSFDSVLKDLTSFLSKYDSEFIIISIKQESENINSSKSFEDVLKQKLDQYESLINFNNTLPETVKEARGKIHILSRYNLSFGYPCFYNWTDDDTFILDSLYVQDNYCINDVDEKIDDIKDTIMVSNSDSNDKLVLNFTSCYIDNAFPPTYATTAANYINSWFVDYLNENTNLKLGIVISDFITYELAYAIYRRNY